MWSWIIPIALIIISFLIKDKSFTRVFYTDGTYEDRRDEDGVWLFIVGAIWLIIKLIILFKDGFIPGLTQIWNSVSGVALNLWGFIVNLF